MGTGSIPISPTLSPVVTPTSPPVAAPVLLPTSPPVAAPVLIPTSPPISTPTPGFAGPDSSLIAYLGNWQSCPTLEQISHYTHIVIAFAVTYTWNPSKNQCSTSCTIGSPVPICNNQNNQALVDSWRAAGKKVILSFGGAGMGGSWAGDVNDCWEHCYGKEQSVISQLDTIVRAQNFDGVDIDYEYFYEKPEAQTFLKTVTTGLRSTLPQGSIVTHAPMDPDLLPDTAYYKLLKEVSSSLDFIMPQYYNGFTRPAIDGIDGTGSGSISALSHYNNLVNDMFDGDATKVIFGFCISDCSGTGSNANGIQAASVMSSLRKYYPCNGGAFFWVAAHDTSGSWSQTVSKEIFPYSGCSNEGPTTAPIQSPTNPPVQNPTATPTTQPTPCIDKPSDKFYYKMKKGKPMYKSCKWLGKKTQKTIGKICGKNTDSNNDIGPAKDICKLLCGTCPTASPTETPVQPTPPPVQPTTVPTESPIQPGTCQSGYSGLIATSDCKGFYHCLDGSLINEDPTYCQDGLLFNFDLQVCDWDYNVDCASNTERV